MHTTAEMHSLNQTDDDDLAELAHMKWEAALVRYHHQIVRLKYFWPDSISHFMSIMNLHDALWVSVGNSPNGDYLVLMMRQTDGAYDPDHYLAILKYKLDGVEVVKHTGPGFHEIPDGRNYWLYDEFNMVGDVFLHEILFSDGTQYNIRFTEFSFTKAPMRVDGYIEIK